MIEKRKYKLNLIEIYVKPTNLGKLIPKCLREKLSLFINGLLESIHVKYKVIKK